MKNSIFLSVIISLTINAVADTRGEIRTQELKSHYFGKGHETDENNKVVLQTGVKHDIDSKDLGIRSVKKPSEDIPIRYHVVLRVSCSDVENDFLPVIPRNRAVDWNLKRGTVTTHSGFAHIDNEGYARFIVDNVKPSQMKKIKIVLNTEEKDVDVQNGPFDLVYKRKTCSEKRVENKDEKSEQKQPSKS